MGVVVLAVVDVIEVVIMEEEEGMAILEGEGDAACLIAVPRLQLVFYQVLVGNKRQGSLPL